jgi:phosphoglycolate phosphatase
MSNTLRAAIFDLDGTLLDTLEDIGDSMNAVLRSLGLPEHPLADYRRFVGSGLGQLVARAMGEAARDKALLARAGAMAEAEYGRRWADKTRPYDGAVEMLATLKAKGLPLAILSNKPDAFTRLSADRYFSPSPFAHVWGERPDYTRKPAPDGAIALARLMGVTPGEVAFLGDSDIDMKTARAAGMLAVGAAWGFRGETELLAAGADMVIRRPMDMLTLFGE